MSLLRFPGLIDIHVHLRDPGSTQKEDFATGSRAAIAGGFTFIIDMPNNQTPTISIERLKEKKILAERKSYCEIGFHYGTDGLNMDTFPEAWHDSTIYGLKVYFDKTTGSLMISDEKKLQSIFASWESDKPILAHAEGDSLELAIHLASKYSRRLHVCHISQKSEIDMVKKAKLKKVAITAGVTPHHLFLSQIDVKRLGAYGRMKPEIGDVFDQSALWEGLYDKTIDIIESDHAPHSKTEKESDTPPYGIPGLESTLGLLLSAVHDKKVTLTDVKMWLFDRPKQIFFIDDQPQTFIEFDPEKPYIIGETKFETKCGWSAFSGHIAYGKVEQVIYKNRYIVHNGKIV